MSTSTRARPSVLLGECGRLTVDETSRPLQYGPITADVLGPGLGTAWAHQDRVAGRRAEKWSESADGARRFWRCRVGKESRRAGRRGPHRRRRVAARWTGRELFQRDVAVVEVPMAGEKPRETPSPCAPPTTPEAPKRQIRLVPSPTAPPAGTRWTSRWWRHEALF